MSSTIILSNPLGPNELFTTFAIAWVARTIRHDLVTVISAELDSYHTIRITNVRTAYLLPAENWKYQ
jgi:hypothetical protein